MFTEENGKIWLATGSERVYLNPSMANRHGLIAGATGTGKTVTLKVIAESFSEMGVPVFIADIKGDVSGMCLPGCENKHIRRSIDTMGIENFNYTAFPVHFFDVYGKLGHPVRTTISDMGPELLARLLDLNEIQSGVLEDLEELRVWLPALRRTARSWVSISISTCLMWPDLLSFCMLFLTCDIVFLPGSGAQRSC